MKWQKMKNKLKMSLKNMWKIMQSIKQFKMKVEMILFDFIKYNF